jgi:peptidyl-dipeptidase A
MFAALSLTLLTACNQPTPQAPLVQVDKRYAKIVGDLAVADRDTTSNRTDKEARRLKVQYEQERVAFFNDPDVIAAIESARGHSDPAVAFKGEAYWRHAVYIRSWTEEEKARETELLARIESVRNNEASWTNADGSLELSITGRWDSVAADADDLSVDDREEFAGAWLEHRLRWMDEDLTALISLRNEVAKREGFANYWEMSLYHRGLEPAGVGAFLDEVQDIVGPLNRKVERQLVKTAKAGKLKNNFANHELLRRAAGVNLDEREAEIWFDTDRAKEVVSTMLHDLGFDPAGIQVYTGPSRYTRRGAYSFAIQPPQHLAVVVSVDHRKNIWPYRALAHEMGRALWWRHISPEDATSPVLWEPPAAYLEGFGQFFERLISQPEFAKRYIPELPAEMSQQMSAAKSQDIVDTLTWYLGSTHIERAMYEKPGDWRALTRQAAKLEKEIRGWEWDAPMDSDGRAWSSFLESGIMLNYPGYVQNFLYEHAVASALNEAVVKAVGSPVVGNDKVATWLITELVQKVGPTLSFEQRLAELSGSQPRTAALKAYLGAE